ncbi:cytochrome P450 4B1-like [Gastrophryne carolinensis]
MVSYELLGFWSLWDLGQWAAGIVLLCLLFQASTLYVKWKELSTALRPFSGPKRHWLYGNAHEFRNDGSDLDIVMRYAEQYPYAFPLWLGNFFAMLTVCHPDYAKTILSRQDPKNSFGYYFITPWIGKGLLVLSGQKWFQHRRLLTPGFHYDVLKPYVKLTSNCVNVMLDKWEHLIKDKPVELFHHVSLMTLDTIMKCAFSYESNCQLDSENSYIKAVYDLTYLADYRFTCLPYHSDLIFYLSPHGFHFRRALRTAHQHTDKVIRERKESLKEEIELEKIHQKRHLDFLDILLCAKDDNGKGLSDVDLRAEVDTFMFEGHDTTASGISWALYCMAKYPEHQEKCRKEIREVLGDRNTVEWEDLGKMSYTTMCIKESLRLYPPVPEVARDLTSPITFCDGRSLPKGASVLISLYAINRCPSVWEDPEVFDPLRFSSENSSKRSSHAFLPFSAGGRNCIGQTFAMNEMKVALALTLQRFELHPDPDNEPIKQLQLVLKSMNGIHLNLVKIGQNNECEDYLDALGGTGHHCRFLNLNENIFKSIMEDPAAGPATKLSAAVSKTSRGKSSSSPEFTPSTPSHVVNKQHCMPKTSSGKSSSSQNPTPPTSSQATGRQDSGPVWQAGQWTRTSSGKSRSSLELAPSTPSQTANTQDCVPKTSSCKSSSSPELAPSTPSQAADTQDHVPKTSSCKSSSSLKKMNHVETPEQAQAADAEDNPSQTANPETAKRPSLAHLRRFFRGVIAFLNRLNPVIPQQRRQEQQTNQNKQGCQGAR